MMTLNLKLKRIFKGDSYTIGKLYINGVYFCDTIEDVDRNLRQDMSLEEIKSIKIKHKTAIPTGRYEITLDIISPKFSKYKQYQFCNGKLPRLLNVPGFSSILVHCGNTADDSSGCILVGLNKVKGKVINSTATFRALYDQLKFADKIFIDIE